MITVHHLENSRSQRILWLLEELSVPYEVKRYLRDRKTKLAPPELLAVHPLGKSPVLVDGSHTVAESGAIVEYLVDRHGRHLRPEDEASRLRYTYWLHFAEGTAMPPLVMSLVFGRIRNGPMPFFAKPIARGIADAVMKGFVTPNIERQLAYIESELTQRPWFSGDSFSAADVQMSFPLEAAAVRGGLNATAHPASTRWLSTVRARPAYKRALERGGPYELMR